jgi:hypothetical protein
MISTSKPFFQLVGADGERTDVGHHEATELAADSLT